MHRVNGFLAMLATIFSVSVASAQTSGQLTVSGEGSVFAVPDMAVISMGASSEAKTAKDAMDETSQITAAILDRLDGFDIALRDVQTSDLSLNPVWSNRMSDNSQPRIQGYQASNRVTVRIRDLTILGAVLDAVLTDGANTLGGLSFALSDPEPLMNEARVNAVADARARAELFATAAGVKLGALKTLSESGVRMPRPEMMSMARAADAGVPVAEGETELRAGVTLTYEITSP